MLLPTDFHKKLFRMKIELILKFKKSVSTNTYKHNNKHLQTQQQTPTNTKTNTFSNAGNATIPNTRDL